MAFDSKAVPTSETHFGRLWRAQNRWGKMAAYFPLTRHKANKTTPASGIHAAVKCTNIHYLATVGYIYIYIYKESESEGFTISFDKTTEH
jgi:hypothetical protein